MSKKKPTLEQRRAIYCVMHGHSDVINVCFGQVTCGRCGDIIGDLLMSRFATKDKVVLGHGCKDCIATAKKLSKTEMTMLPPDALKEVKALRGTA